MINMRDLNMLSVDQHRDTKNLGKLRAAMMSRLAEQRPPGEADLPLRELHHTNLRGVRRIQILVREVCP